MEKMKVRIIAKARDSEGEVCSKVFVELGTCVVELETGTVEEATQVAQSFSLVREVNFKMYLI